MARFYFCNTIKNNRLNDDIPMVRSLKMARHFTSTTTFFCTDPLPYFCRITSMNLNKRFNQCGEKISGIFLKKKHCRVDFPCHY